MNLAFENKDLREVCEDEAAAQRKYGLDVATSLKNRLLDLRAATSIRDVLAGRPTEIPHALYTKYKVHLQTGYAIYFSCNHIKPPLKEGQINWEKVRNIKIISIGNSDE